MPPTAPHGVRLARTSAPGCHAGMRSLRYDQPRSVSGLLRGRSLPDRAHPYDRLTGANGASPWECTAGVTPAPTRIRDRRAEARRRPGRLCSRNGVAVPTNLPKCPACACGQKTTLRTPRWRPSRASAPHEKD